MNQIIKYIEASFPRQTSALVFEDQFKHCNKKTLFEAVRTFCRKEQFFSYAKLHTYYELQEITWIMPVYQLMLEEGYFEEIYPKCTHFWHNEKLKEKVLNWLNNTNSMPNWFKEDIKPYHKKYLKNLELSEPQTKRIA